MSAAAAIRRELAPAVPLAAFFLLFFAAPLALLAGISFFADAELQRVGLAQYAKFFGDAFNWGVLGETLLLGLEVTVVCIVLAYPLGLYYLEAGERMRTLLIFVIILPLLTSAVVRTFAWIVILGREGIVNGLLLDLGLADAPLKLLYTTGGVVVALAQIQLPLMALPVINSLLRIDPSLIQASRGLGAGRWRTFWRVLLPLTAPGLIAGAPARVRRVGHGVHHAIARRRRAPDLHAALHLPAGGRPAELAVRRDHLGDLHGRGDADRLRREPVRPQPARGHACGVTGKRPATISRCARSRSPRCCC